MDIIHQEFQKIFNCYFDSFRVHIRVPIFEDIFDQKFWELVFKYWDNIKGRKKEKLHAQDIFFSKFSIFWNFYIDTKDFINGHKLWENLYKMALKWEKNNNKEKLHKGSLFYFWGANYLFSHAIDEAYILLHQAVNEDKRSQIKKKPDTPAFRFVTLEEKGQYLGNYVKIQINFIEGEIQKYNVINQRNFTFQEFKVKFLESDFIDEIFLFSFIISKYIDIVNIQSKLFNNQFTNLAFLSLIFDLTNIIERLLKVKSTKGDKFQQYLVQLSISNNLNITQDLQNLNNNIKSIGFENLLKNIIQNKYLINNKTKLTEIERNIYLSYLIRNHRAHNISSVEVISKKQDDIFSSILYTLFYVIDTIY